MGRTSHQNDIHVSTNLVQRSVAEIKRLKDVLLISALKLQRVNLDLQPWMAKEESGVQPEIHIT